MKGDGRVLEPAPLSGWFARDGIAVVIETGRPAGNQGP